MTLIKNKLVPSDGMHLKNIISGDIHEGAIYLGIYDSKENYIEVSEEEYQEWINSDGQSSEATDEDLYGALAELGVKEDD